MSDILTRLLLNTGDYDKKLAKAKASSNDFASNIGGKALSAVGKFAGGIGIALGGVEAFNKVMRSSQTLSDQFDNTMNALKGSVDAFFMSIATGNWSAFNGGLMETIRNMREVSALQDMLADAKLSMGFETRKFEREFVRLEGIVNNERLGKAERERAFADMQKLIADFKDKAEKTAKGAGETLVKEMNAKFGQNFTLADLEKYITEVNNEFLGTETLQRLNKYKETLAKFEPGGSRSVEGGYVVTQEQYMEMNAELEKMRILQDDNDKSRKNMIAQLEYAVELQRRADEYLKRSLKKQIKVDNLNKSSAQGKGNPIAGSIDAIDKEIKRLQEEYASTASDSAREAAYKAIKELQAEKYEIEFYVKFKQPKYVGQKQGLGMSATLPTSLSKIEIPIKAEDVKVNEDYVDSLNALANVMGAINGATAEGIAGWLAWSASVMTASAQAVESIRKVVAAKTAEGVASAGASAASTPVVGWLMVGGAILAALAAFTKIPKFAEGGTVGGSSFIGDKLIARVNSGETILTQKQSARALALMDGGNNVRVSGDVRLSGKDIYISLRNYMSSTGNRL